MLKHAIRSHIMTHSVEKKNQTNNPTTPFQTTSFTQLAINIFISESNEKTF